MEGAKSFTLDEQLNNLDNLTAEQLDALKKKFWFNREKCTDQFIDALRSDLLNKLHKPCVFDDDTTRKIIPPLLFEQFKKHPCSEDDLLLHNIEPLNLSRLYEWQPFESIQTFFNPIHYQIAAKKQPIAAKSLDRIFDLQNVLVGSYQRPITTFSVRDVIGQLEVFLDATMTEIFLFTNAVIFMLDWSNLRDYTLFVAFKVDFKLEGHEYVSFERVALFDDIVEESSLEMSKIRESLKTFKLSYHNHAFAKK